MRSQLTMIIESVLNELRFPMVSAPMSSMVKRSASGGGVGVALSAAEPPGVGVPKPEKTSVAATLARYTIAAAPACGAIEMRSASASRIAERRVRLVPRAASTVTRMRHGMVRSKRAKRSVRRPGVAIAAAVRTTPKRRSAPSPTTRTTIRGRAARSAARRRPLSHWPSPGTTADAAAARREPVLGVDSAGIG